jgi:hypothetical protein
MKLLTENNKVEQEITKKQKNTQEKKTTIKKLKEEAQPEAKWV